MDSLRRRIADFIGFAPDPERPTAQVVERHAQIGYTRSLVRYTVADGDLVDAFLFEPTATRALRTGVLVFHQHNSQWAIGKSEVAGLVGDSLQAFGPELARRGIVVLAPDSVGFESRLDTGTYRHEFGARIDQARWFPRGLAPVLQPDGSSSCLRRLVDSQGRC